MYDTHRSSARLISVLVVCLFAAFAASADELDAAGEASDVTTPTPATSTDAAATASAEDAAGAFRPPASELAKSDWLRLNSGEWIKGNIEYMRDGDLNFDSAELDDLVIGMGDIAELHSPDPNRFLFDDGEVLIGPAMIQGDTLTIFVGGQPQSFPRAKLIAILEGEQRERNYWSFGLGFGLTGRSGNTDSLDMSGDAYVKRETARTRWNTKYLGAFAELDGDTNTNNHRVTSQFDYFLTPRLYLIPILFEFYNDRFQNVDYRLTPAAGVGYELFKRKSITWDVAALAGYQYSQFRGGETEGTFVTVFGTAFEADITKYLEFDFLYRVNLGIPDVNKTTHHSEAVFSFDIWGPLDFDVSLIFDRLEDPRPDDDGSTPKKNDLQLMIGLGVDF